MVPNQETSMTKTKVTSANYLTADLPAGRYACGAKLYLVVNPRGKKGEPGARHWQFVYWRGRRRKLGLGSAKAVKWTAAKAVAMEKCAMLAKGIDPGEQRDAQRAS